MGLFGEKTPSTGQGDLSIGSCMLESGLCLILSVPLRLSAASGSLESTLSMGRMPSDPRPQILFLSIKGDGISAFWCVKDRKSDVN